MTIRWSRIKPGLYASRYGTMTRIGDGWWFASRKAPVGKWGPYVSFHAAKCAASRRVNEQMGQAGDE